MTDAGDLGTLVEQRHVVVCCGTGGVGKTTVAAALALEGARRGRDAIVVTIDPARRLAQALGLEALTDRPREIDAALWDVDGTAAPGGRLSALMLDAKGTFDRLITRHAESEERATRILENGFYRNVSGALGGTQEYMAMEQLHELHEDGRFDLIVVDTPPTRHALDFLEAPQRMTRLLDNAIFRLLMRPTRAGLHVAGVAVQAFLRTIARVVGREVIDDVVAFLRAFEGMEEGFRSRAVDVRVLLADEGTAFVLVTSPRRDAVEEAAWFGDRLADHGLEVDALVVNRVHPGFGTDSAGGLRARVETLTTRARAGDGDGPAAARLAALYANLADFREIAEGEREHLRPVHERLGGAVTAFVPFLPRDVHDFTALAAIGRHLFAPDGTAGDDPG